MNWSKGKSLIDILCWRCFFRCSDPNNHKDFKRATGAAIVRYDKSKGCLLVIVSIRLIEWFVHVDSSRIYLVHSWCDSSSCRNSLRNAFSNSTFKSENRSRNWKSFETTWSSLSNDFHKDIVHLFVFSVLWQLNRPNVWKNSRSKANWWVWRSVHMVRIFTRHEKFLAWRISKLRMRLVR